MYTKQLIESFAVGPKSNLLGFKNALLAIKIFQSIDTKHKKSKKFNYVCSFLQSYWHLEMSNLLDYLNFYHPIHGVHMCDFSSWHYISSQQVSKYGGGRPKKTVQPKILSWSCNNNKIKIQGVVCDAEINTLRKQISSQFCYFFEGRWHTDDCLF